MNTDTELDQMIDHLAAMFESENHAHHTPPMPGLPTLRSVLAEAGSLPREALFLGLAEDGLPVMLNLFDPTPGPILISGDQASGKTALLKMIAQGINLMHTPEDVQYGVITPHPGEWKMLEQDHEHLGVYETGKESAGELISSLSEWAHQNKNSQQSVVLLIDNLEQFANLGEETQQNLRWLLLRGPSRRVWPIVTLNPSRALHLNAWLGFFRTRLFGFTKNEREAAFISRDSSSPLQSLISGSQFSMRLESDWLNFWIPTSE